MNAFFRSGARNRQMVVLASRGRWIIVMGICGTLLAGCASVPNRLNVGVAVSDSDLVGSPYQTGELHLVLMPPDSLMSGVAEARR
jgi:hypothetical protein